MTASKGATRFFRGFATAAMGLGVLLGVLWLALWGIEAAGGPDWRMPMRLLQSAATLVVIGWVFGMLLQARGAKETA
jgi:hypothetical protein